LLDTRDAHIGAQAAAMIGVLSLSSFLVGVALASLAERYPSHIAVLQQGAGTLMIAGLALLGAWLPLPL
jgi:hypothetical protein